MRWRLPLGWCRPLGEAAAQLVAVTIWELWDNGHVGELAAFSLIITIGTVFVGSVFLNIAQRYGLQD